MSTQSERRDLAWRVSEPGLYELSLVRSERVDQALRSPETLWAFVTSPTPMYLERRAAAVQGRRLVPFDWLPMMWRVTRELEREQGIHRWGLRNNPRSCQPDWFVLGRKRYSTEPRQVLQRTWTPPSEMIDYPLTPEELERAPWPWQVEHALRDLRGGLIWAVNPGERVEDRAEAYLKAVLSLPCTTDEDAATLVRASWGSDHYKSLAMIGALRNIVLNPNMPRAAVSASTDFTNAIARWDNEAAWWLGSATVLDILRNSPHVSARDQVARTMSELRVGYRPHRMGPTEARPIPAAAILEAARVAVDSSSDEAQGVVGQSRRLHSYVSGVLRTLDDPPFKLESNLKVPSLGATQRLQEFASWFDRNLAVLETLARQQAEGLAAAQRQLMAITTCRH